MQVQHSHLRTVLTLCVRSKTTHLLLAVSSVLQQGCKSRRDVLHCYALIWDGEKWNVTDTGGATRDISFARHSEEIPELAGAVII